MSEFGAKEAGLRILDAILANPENKQCVDCGSLDCSWASTSLGCFVCIWCSSVHRQLGVHISRIKSVQLDSWEDSDCLALHKFGNAKVENLYASNRPGIYMKPTVNSPRMLVEHWIRAKYEWREFHRDADSTPMYLKGVKSGTLLKKGKERGCWPPRHFILDRLNNSIAYYDKATTTDQKKLGKIDLTKCYVLIPDIKLMERPNTLHIMLHKGKHIRSIYVSAASNREIVEWYYAIRTLQTQLGFSRNCVETIMESFLSKTPPEGKGQWRTRWCILTADRIFYYKNLLDPFPKGVVLLASGDGVEKLLEPPKYLKSGPDYKFIVTTKKRVYYWGTQNEETCLRWINAISAVLGSLWDGE